MTGKLIATQGVKRQKIITYSLSQITILTIAASKHFQKIYVFFLHRKTKKVQ